MRFKDLQLAVHEPVTFLEYGLRYTIGPFVWLYEAYFGQVGDAENKVSSNQNICPYCYSMCEKCERICYECIKKFSAFRANDGFCSEDCRVMWNRRGYTGPPRHTTYH